MWTMPTARTVGNGIGLALAFVWAYGSQAHFTDRFTPELAKDVHGSAKELHNAFGIANLSIDEVSDRLPDYQCY